MLLVRLVNMNIIVVCVMEWKTDITGKDQAVLLKEVSVSSRVSKEYIHLNYNRDQCRWIVTPKGD